MSPASNWRLLKPFIKPFGFTNNGPGTTQSRLLGKSWTWTVIWVRPNCIFKGPWTLKRAHRPQTGTASSSCRKNETSLSARAGFSFNIQILLSTMMGWLLQEFGSAKDKLHIFRNHFPGIPPCLPPIVRLKIRIGGRDQKQTNILISLEYSLESQPSSSGLDG